MILDFLKEVVKRPTVLVGNSVGSLACVIAAAGFQSTNACKSLPLQTANSLVMIFTQFDLANDEQSLAETSSGGLCC